MEPELPPQRRWDDVPLTRSVFEHWLDKEFRPHTAEEAESQNRMTRIEASLETWLRILTVGGSITIVLGSTILGLFTWILMEKNAVLVSLGESLRVVSERQQVVLRTIQIQGDSIQQLQRDQRAQNDVLIALAERVKR